MIAKTTNQFSNFPVGPSNVRVDLCHTLLHWFKSTTLHVPLTHVKDIYFSFKTFCYDFSMRLLESRAST